METTPFNEQKFKDINDKIDFYCDPTPPEVQEWAETQIIMADIERRKALTDTDIRNSLIFQFKQVNADNLGDEDKNKYAGLCMKYGL